MQTELHDIGRWLVSRDKQLAVAESCTGGLLAAAITDIPGASAWFERGLVTYSNAAKQALLGVPEAVLAQYGAVSEPTARAMVKGLLPFCDYALSTTGIAGPGGATATKPVGMVCFGLGVKDAQGQRFYQQTQYFQGDRQAVRQQAIAFAVHWLHDVLKP